MEVAGDPLPVLVERCPTEPFLETQGRHRRAGGYREQFDGDLVLLVEAARLLGQVEVAEHPLADPDRDP